jgi:Na+-translocating ferredoxin:NAD+ oxidoreductase RnfC subunit
MDQHMPLSSAEIIKSVRSAGVIGAGGGGFPTYVKLGADVDTIIANGSECEPLLASDKALLKEQPALVVDGLKIAMNATGAAKGIIAVKGHYQDVIAAIQPHLPPDNSIEIFQLDNYYPAGDEFLTVYDTTGRVIPEGGLPLDVGVVVSNVLTLAQISHAVNGKPVTERPITITGSVRNPITATVPIGATYNDVVNLAGGTVNPDDIILDGGPMMGCIVEDPNQGIARTTSGIIALPADHFIIRARQTTLSQMVKKSKAACCQCYRCTDLCPRNLMGHALYPHMTMRTIDYNLSQPTDHITSAFLCSQCGVCELIACDFMILSPRKIYAEYRKLLMAKGIRNPHRNTVSALSELEYRKVPVPLILKKLDLTRFAGIVTALGQQTVSKVRVPLDRHAGAPAQPMVQIGQSVAMGDVIAASPQEGLGAVCHASIAGNVTDITAEWIEIQGNQA